MFTLKRSSYLCTRRPSTSSTPSAQCPRWVFILLIDTDTSSLFWSQHHVRHREIRTALYFVPGNAAWRVDQKQYHAIVLDTTRKKHMELKQRNKHELVQFKLNDGNDIPHQCNKHAIYYRYSNVTHQVFRIILTTMNSGEGWHDRFFCSGPRTGPS